VTVEFHGLFKMAALYRNTALALALAAEVSMSRWRLPMRRVRTAPGMGNFSDLKSYYAARGITLDYVRRIRRSLDRSTTPHRQLLRLPLFARL